MTFDPAPQRLPKLIAILAAALLAPGSAPGQQPQLDWQHIGNRELATALCGGFDPAETGLAFRSARIPMFRMLPGFLSDAGSVVSGDDAPGSDGSAGLLVNFGDDNPYFDPRRERQEDRPEGPPYTAFTIRPRPGMDPREAVYRLARDRGWLLRELTRVPVSLEEVFLEIVAEAAGRAGEEPRVSQEASR